MKRTIASFFLIVSLAIAARPASANPSWVGPFSPDTAEIDLNSVRLVDRGVYQYRDRLSDSEDLTGRRWRYFYSYTRLNCNHSQINFMERDSDLYGSAADRRMHGSGWLPGYEQTTRFMCTYAAKNAIPKLESNWDLTPESSIRFADH